MLYTNLKYRLFIRWAFLLALLFFLGGCKSFRPSFLKTELERKIDVAYHDPVRLVKIQHVYDSCGLVLHKEWDSVLKAMPTVSFSELLADSIIEYAKEFMGVPYKPNGNGPNTFDCSGFTHFVFKHFGYKLKRTTEGQLLDGWDIITNPRELRRGDLVFFGGRKHPKNLGHVGIVVDNDPESNNFTFIHATVHLGVTISAVTEKYYQTRYLTACRILPEL
jgi:hypothetical protein